jgi:integrase
MEQNALVRIAIGERCNMTAITSAKEKRTMEQKLAGLKDQTRANYMRDAETFFRERLGGRIPTPKTIKDTLRAAALEYRPATWRKIRNAIMYQQIATGHHDTAALVKTIYNPATSPKTTVDELMSKSVEGKPGKPQKRLKKLPDEELDELYAEIMERYDHEVGAAVMLAQITGCRPAEMLDIEALDDGIIFLRGAKRTDKGDRGLDRYLQVTPEEWSRVKNSVEALKAVDPGKAGTMRKVQDRLNTVTKALWPRRKTRPTLYTFRYVMGSNLKSSDLTRQEVAYIMGHQSEQSVDRYGNPRSGSGKSPIKPAPGADLSGVRKGFKAPFEPAPAPTPSAGPGLG